MIDKKIIQEKYGPSSSADNIFAAKARFLQSWYRAHILKQETYGYGPDETSETKYGNILVSGEVSGSNFLFPEIFKYAQYRAQFLKKGETIKEYRLFNNMLSSQPLCFNLFYPMKALFEHDHIAAGKILRNCFPTLQIATILAIEIEYLPYPVNEYLNDRTAFDAMLIYITDAGERNILAIETKYVEKLGTNPSSDLSKQIDLVNNSLIFNEFGKQKVLSGFGQLGRNFLLAEKFGIQNRLNKAFAVVISPKENDSSTKEINEFYSMMQPEFHHRLFYTSLEYMVDQIKSTAPKALIPWIENFNKRYLGFSECDSFFKEYKKQ